MTTTIENKEFWQRQIEKLNSSGLSRAQYCRDNEIDYHRFGYWLKSISPTQSKFIPVKMQFTEKSSTHVALCTLELRGHILKIHDLSALSLLLDRMA